MLVPVHDYTLDHTMIQTTSAKLAVDEMAVFFMMHPRTTRTGTFLCTWHSSCFGFHEAKSDTTTDHFFQCV